MKGEFYVNSSTQMHSKPPFRNYGIAKSFEMSLGTQRASSLPLEMRRVDLVQPLFACMRPASAPGKHVLLSNQPQCRERTSAIWFCDRLPCRGQVHGAGHTFQHAA